MKKRNILGLALVLLLLIMIHASVASATAWYVDNNALPGGTGLSWQTAFSSVQGGINAAVSGNEVWVKQGTYYENIIIKDGVGLYGGFAGTENLRSQRDWNQYITIIDAGGNGHAVFIDNCSSTYTRIDGFTIRNGYFQPYDPGYTDGGGGIYCNQSNPVIENNSIIDNYGYFGGGIYTLLSSPTIINNSVMNNGALQGGAGIYLNSSSGLVSKNLISGNNVFYFGPGIYNNSSTTTISNNVIINNSGSPSGSSGGGIYLWYAASAILNNTISNNWVSAIGGGIDARHDHSTIANNIFDNNACQSGMGSGLHLDDFSFSQVVNNTIVHNTGGAAVYTFGFSRPSIYNNVIAFNDAGIWNGEYALPSLANNNFYGNNAFDYWGVSPGIGDISADPLFVDSTVGDYHLRVGSPCINAGDNTVVQFDWTDIDGAPRVTLSDGVGIVDIGADEYYADTTPPAVMGTIPLDNAANIPLNQIISITFSEDIQVVPPGSNIFLYDEKRFVLVGRTLSINGNVLTITPELLRKDTIYSVNIPEFSIKDLAGNEMAADKVFYFTTVKK